LEGNTACSAAHTRNAPTQKEQKEMTASGSYDLQASHRDVTAEIQRLAAQARSGWDKESRTLSWFGLKDGMSVLELGSGPGFITEQLVALLPTSSPISNLSCLLWTVFCRPSISRTGWRKSRRSRSILPMILAIINPRRKTQLRNS